MEQVQLTISHYAFLLTVLSIFISIAFRRGVIIPSIAGIFILGLLSDHSDSGFINTLIFATQILSKALLNAGKELFDIMLVISLMVAMLKSLQAHGADHIMIAPMRKLMIGPRTAFFVLAITMYIAAAFFWPTPAVALVGTVLIPVAIRVGLPALAAAVSVNLAGHGMALSADPIIQGATRLTASSAGIDPSDLLPYTILFSIIAGAVAITLSCYTIRRDTLSGVLKAPDSEQDIILSASIGKTNQAQHPEVIPPGPFAKIFAIGVPVVLLSIAVLMVYRGIFDPTQAIRGGAATALLGGTATALLVLSTFADQGHQALEGIAEHLRDGFFFAIKIFAPIIPIAGFFFLGNPEHAAVVMGEGTPGFLFDIGNYVGKHIDGNITAISFGITFIGFLTGMDGSGFSGLPLTGSLSGALATGAGIDVAVLAALGQVVTIFTGGGTLVAWAFGACADAGIAGVTPAELVRRNFMPVVSGLITITFVAIFLMS
ncbi:MAG: hypothetical protein K9K86_04405 [Pseudomonadales bacterium]|nr:hypothetical protein [Pseudomonadales bacterium]